MGLGRFGGALGLIRFLSAAGARVTVSDAAPAAQLAASAAAVRDLPGVTLRLGGHDARDVETCDTLFVNPAVPPRHPLVGAAAARGTPIATEIGLLLSLCPARVVALTGTSGKSTTCALAAAMLDASGLRVHLGGNVGGSLLADLGTMTSGDTVVLELSSFQLHYLAASRDAWPAAPIAGLRNVYCDHLDWHGTFPHYAAAKRAILAGAPARSGWAVVPGDDALLTNWARRSGRRVLTVGSAPGWADAALAPGNRFRLRDGSGETALFDAGDLCLPGAMNRANAAFAAALAVTAGATVEGIRHAVATFQGLPHRFERVATVRGVTFINSSVATTPLEAARTLEAVRGAAVLLAGGSRVKRLPFTVLAESARGRARAAVFFGDVAGELAAAFADAAPGVHVRTAASLQDAFGLALDEARTGDTVLLAPAAPSYDAFFHFEARGACYRRLVTEHAQAERAAV